MKTIKQTGGVMGLVVLTMGLMFQPVFAEPTDQLERRLTAYVAAKQGVSGLTKHRHALHAERRSQSDMNVMQKDMAAIESEENLDRRRAMLGRHMNDMHKAMAVMQKELMPSMKKQRQHRHKQPFTVANRSKSDAWDSQAHSKKMDQMMAHMEIMMDQISRHRKAMDVGGSD